MADPDRRWTVENSPSYSKEYGPFLDVGAFEMIVEDGGSLVFYDKEGYSIFAMAPGTWLSVQREKE